VEELFVCCGMGGSCGEERELNVRGMLGRNDVGIVGEMGVGICVGVGEGGESF
jgi:hypothetical protein